MPIQAVIFDLDDTLYPESSYALSGFFAVSKWAENNLGLPATETFGQLRSIFLNKARGNVFNIWLRDMGRTESVDLISQLVRVYREHQPVIDPFPGARDLLERLKRHFKIGLVSDGYLEVQRRKLASLGIEFWFDAVVFSDEFGRNCWKPSSKPFEVVAERLRVRSDSAVYVGDNLNKDFFGCRAIGMKTIHVLGDGEYGAAVAPTPLHAPGHTVRALRDILDVVAHL